MVRCSDFYKKWEKDPNWCEKTPAAVSQINSYLELRDELEQRGIDRQIIYAKFPEGAARPVINEKDPDVRIKLLNYICACLNRSEKVTAGDLKNLTTSEKHETPNARSEKLTNVNYVSSDSPDTDEKSWWPIPIVGIGEYDVHPRGLVRSNKSRKLLSQQKDVNGYIRVGMSNGEKPVAFMVHRLIATTFIPNPDDKPFVNHINHDKSDNRVENLEWVTASENTQAYHAKKNEEVKPTILADIIRKQEVAEAAIQQPQPAPCANYKKPGDTYEKCPDFKCHIDCSNNLKGPCCNILNAPLNQLPHDECPLEKRERLKGTKPEEFHPASEDGLGNKFVKPAPLKILAVPLTKAEANQRITDVVRGYFTEKDQKAVAMLIGTGELGDTPLELFEALIWEASDRMGA